MAFLNWRYQGESLTEIGEGEPLGTTVSQPTPCETAKVVISVA
jgi:hypothetical protein